MENFKRKNLITNNKTQGINNSRTANQKRREKSILSEQIKGINKHCSLITLNIIAVNFSIKAHKLTD